MILYSRMCNVCNVCNASLLLAATLLLLSIFIGKCLYFQEKLRTRNSAKYKPLGCLIEAIANAAVERSSQGGQSNGDNIGSYPVLPTNNTRIAANCCDITISKRRGKYSKISEAEYKRQHRIQRSGEAEYKWLMLQQVLQPAAYLERELRRIVCWLLILSAEI